MQRLTSSNPVPDHLRGSILALGNFDGFHLGHQAVVNRAIARGHHERRPVIVATFDPHPVRFFKPDIAPFRLTTLGQRERLFAHAGADAMLVFEFDAGLAATSAEDFIATILAEASPLVDAIGSLSGMSSHLLIENKLWLQSAAPPAAFPKTKSAAALTAATLSVYL